MLMLSIFLDCMKNVQLGNFVNFNNGCSKKKPENVDI